MVLILLCLSDLACSSLIPPCLSHILLPCTHSSDTALPACRSDLASELLLKSLSHIQFLYFQNMPLNILHKTALLEFFHYLHNLLVCTVKWCTSIMICREIRTFSNPAYPAPFAYLTPQSWTWLAILVSHLPAYFAPLACRAPLVNMSTLAVRSCISCTSSCLSCFSCIMIILHILHLLHILNLLYNDYPAYFAPPAYLESPV